MIHYTCDMCGKHIHPEEDTRYVVKVEVHATGELEDEEDLEDVEELEEYDEEDAEDIDEMEYDTLRFDLCSRCHKIYIQDPLFTKGHRSRFFNN
ncbi:MAG TPA: hypothetical protein ACFYD3_02295 [Candidatus Hypogeohydataceae bacterium YC41]